MKRSMLKMTIIMAGVFQMPPNSLIRVAKGTLPLKRGAEGDLELPG